MSEHYNRMVSWEEIRDQIKDATPDGLAPIDQLHSGGLAATRLLAKFARIAKGEKVLDVGCGAGGPSRVLASEVGAVVTAIDLAPGLIELAKRLGEVSHIPVIFEQGDALQLPFEDASFDVVWTQHAACNIADKSRLYAEIRRVLRPGGRLAMHDVLRGPVGGPFHMPMPCGDTEEEAFFPDPTRLKRLLVASGFRELVWRDRTQATIAFFDRLPDPGQFSIRLVLGRRFPEMVSNLHRNLQEGRLATAMGVFEAV